MVHRIFLPSPNVHLAPLPLQASTAPEDRTTRLNASAPDDVPFSSKIMAMVFHKLDPPDYIKGFGGSQSLPLIERVNLSNLRDRTWMDLSQGGLDSLERSTVSVSVPVSRRVLGKRPLGEISEGASDGAGVEDRSKIRGRGGSLVQREEPEACIDIGENLPEINVVNSPVPVQRGEQTKLDITKGQSIESTGQVAMDEDQIAEEEEKDTSAANATTDIGIDISVDTVANTTKDTGMKQKQRKIAATQSTTRRQSKRSTRQSASFLSALPHLEPSPAPAPSPNSPSQSSFDSLDTTTNSLPSQLATNPGNTSVSHFPRWTIPLHKLVALQSILSSTSPHSHGFVHRLAGQPVDKCLHTLVACVISTEPVVQRQRKEEKARGGEGSLWIGKWIITAPGPPPAQQQDAHMGQSEVTTSVRLWDELAREWCEKVRRGDVVLLENIEYKPTTLKEPAHLSLSSHHAPKITILYRTLPRYQSAPTASDYIYKLPQPQQPRLGMLRSTSTSKAQMSAGGSSSKGTMLREDKALRPDLRVGRSDAGVKRVEGVVRWFAHWIGGEAPT
ncbi:hypothetical protein I316_05646 [Kwoniella heveanensis BCC8398]|uniref:Uncharacterized protein n=1 Tax=Kwoniella heveanensis BCC8398 TaxID=1296120 RepID=A0A1B9GPI4_9TREE|nr:hypothetical protein I316_05646 [Kwoniella heveanensis BCC8398]